MKKCQIKYFRLNQNKNFYFVLQLNLTLSWGLALKWENPTLIKGNKRRLINLLLRQYIFIFVFNVVVKEWNGFRSFAHAILVLYGKVILYFQA